MKKKLKRTIAALSAIAMLGTTAYGFTGGNVV